MAYSYLGYSENHQKVYGATGRQPGPFDEYDKINDPHNKLNLASKVKDKQLN